MRKFKIFIIILLFVITLIYVFVLFISNFNIAAERYAQNNIKNFMVSLINDSFHENTVENSSLLDEIIKINYTEQNKISSINVNSSGINLFSSKLVLDITEKIKNTEYKSFGIPLGNAFNIKFFSGLGPKIKVKIVPLGNITNKLNNEFVSVGINQSLYKIHLEIRAVISVLTPFSEDTAEINCTYLLAETVIIGEIPQVYLN